MQKGEPATVQKDENSKVGKIVFMATLVAVLVFFWWLLIYDHGVVSVHG